MMYGRDLILVFLFLLFFLAFPFLEVLEWRNDIGVPSFIYYLDFCGGNMIPFLVGVVSRMDGDYSAGIICYSVELMKYGPLELSVILVLCFESS